MVGINAPNRLLAGWMPKSAVLQFTQRDFANPASATAETVTERVLLRQLSCEDDYDIATGTAQTNNGNTGTAGFRVISLPRSRFASEFKAGGRSWGSGENTVGGDPPGHVYYVSFRTDHGVDHNMAPHLQYKVLVHSGPNVHVDTSSEGGPAGADDADSNAESSDDDGTAGFMLVAVLDEKDTFTSVHGTFTLSVLDIDRRHSDDDLDGEGLASKQPKDQSNMHELDNAAMNQHYYAVVQIKLHTKDTAGSNQGTLRNGNQAGANDNSTINGSAGSGEGAGETGATETVAADLAPTKRAGNRPAGVSATTDGVAGADSADADTVNTAPHSSNPLFEATTTKASSTLAMVLPVVLVCFLVCGVVAWFWWGSKTTTSALPKPFSMFARSNSLGSMICAASSTAAAHDQASDDSDTAESAVGKNDSAGFGRFVSSAAAAAGAGSIARLAHFQRQLSWDHASIGMQWGARDSTLVSTSSQAQLAAPYPNSVDHNLGIIAHGQMQRLLPQPQNLDGMIVQKKTNSKENTQNKSTAIIGVSLTTEGRGTASATVDTTPPSATPVSEERELDELVWDGKGFAQMPAMAPTASSNTNVCADADNAEKIHQKEVWVPRPPAQMPRASRLTFRRTTTEQ